MPTIALGANLITGGQTRLIAKMWNFLGGDWTGLGKGNITVYAKAGVPASNTAGDDPGRAPAFIIDTTGSGVYFVNARTNSTTFTVVKLTP